jgi:hypothetical protein
MKTAIIIMVALCILAVGISSVSTIMGQTEPSNGCKGIISIHGSTNVGSFELKNQVDRILVRNCPAQHDSIASVPAHDYWIYIPVKSFRTNNQQIYQDFLSLVKAEEYPNIRIAIAQVDIHRIKNAKSAILISVAVIIAGKKCCYNIPCQISGCENDCFFLNGSQRMKLTDFRLTPPEKFFGLIRVNNEIKVNFGFSFSIQ